MLQRPQGAGSFAGDPDQQRQGSFADTDHVVIVTYTGAAERVRITGLRGAWRLLRRAALDDDPSISWSASCTKAAVRLPAAISRRSTRGITAAFCLPQERGGGAQTLRGPYLGRVRSKHLL